MTQWILYEPTEHHKVYEVVPEQDIKEHHSSEECPCEPNIQQLQGNYIMISHNAWDGREETEQSKHRK